jgi:HAD superfamily hydrolase (TIGR01549 family)
LYPQPYLLFDAGGTTVFPNEVYLAKLAMGLGIHLEHEKLYTGYYRLIHTLDAQARAQGWQFPRDPWPDGYPWALFQQLGLRSAAARVVAAAAHSRHERHENLWTFTFSWVRETLAELRAAGYRMSVLSNSDGRTEKVFRTLGLRGYFDDIFDSVELGLSKPNAAVFQLVAKRLGRKPAQVLYIGDIYTVDVLGAQNAGMQAVHIDPLGLCEQRLFPGERLRDIRELPAWLERQATVHERAREGQVPAGYTHSSVAAQI